MRNRRLRNMAQMGGAALAIGGVAAVASAAAGTGGLLAVAILCLVPGRVGSWALKPLFTARRALAEGDTVAAEAAARRAIAAISEAPWRRHALKLMGSAYTWDAKAMAENALGAALMARGNLDGAEVAFANALADDTGYPVAHHNLAVVAAARGDERAEAHFAAARAGGYRTDRVDEAIAAVQAAYARLNAGATSRPR